MSKKKKTTKKKANKKKTKTEIEKKSNETTQRKLVAGLFISIDGVTESPNLWQERFDNEMGVDLQKTLADQDAILMGRKTYEEWAQYWPNNTTDPFADYINNIQKYVVSSTLDKVEWGNYGSISLFNDLEKGMSGSTTLVLSLIKANLLDELYLMIHPVMVGHGNHLFNDDFVLKRLKLIYSKTTESDVIIAKYKILND